MYWRTRRAISDMIESYPRVYVNLQRWRYRKNPLMIYDRIVNDFTDLLIEGFPRCANSFAVKAFRFSNDLEWRHKIATHLHSPAHIKLAVKWSIPAIVLIRNPDNAVLSKLGKILEFSEESFTADNLRKREMIRLVSYYTKRFSAFYKALLPISRLFVASDFDEITSDFSGVIKRVNDMYRTEFALFEHTEENVLEIFESSGSHLSPSPLREHYKNLFRELYFSEVNAQNRKSAICAYSDFKRLNGIN